MGTVILLKKPNSAPDPFIPEEKVRGKWVEFVQHGEARAARMLGEDLESFLVFALMRFMRRTDLFSVVLALEYLNAATTYVGQKRKNALGEVGDISLILAGLFPERARVLNVSESYFTNMGRAAFDELANSFGKAKLFEMERLCRNVEGGFPAMVQVLAAARKCDTHLPTSLVL